MTHYNSPDERNVLACHNSWILFVNLLRFYLFCRCILPSYFYFLLTFYFTFYNVVIQYKYTLPTVPTVSIDRYRR